jgi:hypothetical protein
VHSNLIIARLKTHTKRSIAMSAWIFLGFLYVCLVSQWFTISRRDKLFTEYIDHAIEVAATEHYPAREVRAQLLMKAEDLSLPIQADEIHVSDIGNTLRATVHYRADISMPIVNQRAYRLSFAHDLSAKSIQ